MPDGAEAEQSAHAAPDLVDDVDPGLLQQRGGDEAARDGHPPRPSLQQLLAKAAPLHHVGTQALGSVHHGHQHCLRRRRWRSDLTWGSGFTALCT